MYELDFSSPAKVFFCGIGGISMSGLAEILRDRGFDVSGSDRLASSITDHLIGKGIRIFIGQTADNITKDLDVFVYTAAVKADHPELVRAKELGIPVLTRAELLGLLMKNYETPIAVSGTHGKTTVTGMLTEILLKNESDPTVSIGGILRSIGGNVRIGGPDYFVFEACEYTNSFLSFFPKIALILNIEEDHLDFFKDIDDIRNSFRRFASLVPEDGAVIIGNEIPEKDRVISSLSCRVITFGEGKDADYHPEDVRTDEDGLTRFKAAGGNPDTTEDAEFTLRVPGFHNVLNALSAIAAADLLGVPRAITRDALLSYGGTDRRFEEKGTVNGIRIIDDYAHHPSEIRATLRAARTKTSSKIWVVFQPHTYSRTKAFLSEFADALSLADAVILADIYAAREKDNLGISSENIAEKLRDKNIECYYIPSFEEIEKFIKENCAPGEMLITMGAGDVVNIANDLTAE